MRLTREQAKNLSGGGSQFFRLGEGQSAMIRFLYNSVADLDNEALAAHSILPQESGQQYTINVMCGLSHPDAPLTECKWCATNHKQVARYPLALYNEDTQQVEYWLKSGQYVDALIAQLEQIVPQGQPISGQIFKIIRTGKGTQTQYPIIPTGMNDGKTSNMFGEVKVPEERGLLRPADYEFPAVTNNGVNVANNFNGGNNYNNGNNFNNFQSTRRTTDVF